MEQLTAKEARKISGVKKPKTETQEQVEKILAYVEDAAMNKMVELEFLLPEKFCSSGVVHRLESLGYTTRIKNKRSMNIKW